MSKIISIFIFFGDLALDIAHSDRPDLFMSVEEARKMQKTS